MAEPARRIDDGSAGSGSGWHVGERILGGTYKLLRRLDSGSMGTVFEAEHLRLHRNVAVKLLAPGLSSRPDLLARFRLEAEVVSQLEHPHIVTALDFDVTEQGEPYLVLELLHGETLEQRIDRDAPLALEDVVRIATQIASALSVAHHASVVHRDLKPSNIFLTDAPNEPVFVKLLDFGISKNLRADRHLTQPRILVGTPEYMAPEQARGQNDLVDARTDQYALAVVVYEMLTGLQPFAHADLKEVLGRVAKLEPAPPSSIASWIPARMDEVLARAMAKDPAKRFGDVMEFAREFAAAAADLDSPLRSSPSIAPRSDVRASTSAVSSANDVLKCQEGVPVALRDDAVGSRAPRLCVTSALAVRDLPLSPRAAFLLSRIDDGMTVDDLLDVAGMPRLEALQCLAKLVSCGAVELGPRRSRSEHCRRSR